MKGDERFLSKWTSTTGKRRIVTDITCFLSLSPHFPPSLSTSYTLSLSPNPVWIPAVSISGRWPNQLKFTKSLHQFSESDGVRMKREKRETEEKEGECKCVNSVFLLVRNRYLLKWFQSQIEDWKRYSLFCVMRILILLLMVRRKGSKGDEKLWEEK